MVLPLTITPGDLGHVSDHIEIDTLLEGVVSPFIIAADDQGTHAARPAAGTQGRYYWETDTSKLFRDNGSSWQEISLRDATVTPTKLALNPQTDQVLGSVQTTTSTSYTDLGTDGPAVTVSIGANGLALVSIYCLGFTSNVADEWIMSYAVSGATVIAPGEPHLIAGSNTDPAAFGATWLVTGLSPGTTFFHARYRAGVGGTASFQNRVLSVVPL